MRWRSAASSPSLCCRLPAYRFCHMLPAAPKNPAESANDAAGNPDCCPVADKTAAAAGSPKPQASDQNLLRAAILISSIRTPFCEPDRTRPSYQGLAMGQANRPGLALSRSSRSERKRMANEGERARRPRRLRLLPAQLFLGRLPPLVWTMRRKRCGSPLLPVACCLMPTPPSW